MDSQNQQSSSPPNEEAKRLLRLYGKVPTRTGLLQQQLEGRKYFDSGDFALSQAHKSSSAGAVKTGREHPHREEISHPFSPVPSSSNVDEDANQQGQGENSTGEKETGRKSSAEIKHASHLSEMVPEK